MRHDDANILDLEFYQSLGRGAEDELDRFSVWRCKDGRTVRICDMVDSHLLNTIRVLRNLSPLGTRFKTDDVTRRRWLNVMATEAYRRGLELDELTAEEPTHE